MKKEKYRELKPGDVRKDGDQSRANPKYLTEPTITDASSVSEKQRRDEWEVDTTWKPIPESFHGHELFSTDFISTEYRRPI